MVLEPALPDKHSFHSADLSGTKQYPERSAGFTCDQAPVSSHKNSECLPDLIRHDNVSLIEPVYHPKNGEAIRS